MCIRDSFYSVPQSVHPSSKNVDPLIWCKVAAYTHNAVALYLYKPIITSMAVNVAPL